MTDKEKKTEMGVALPLALASIGSLLAGMVLVGGFLGYFLDQWLGCRPLFMFLLAVLGFIGGMIRAKETLLESMR